MACGTVWTAILSLPSRKELAIHSPRTAAVKACVTEVLEACKKEENKDRFTTFSVHLVALLSSTLQGPVTTPASLSRQRKRLWVTFCKLRMEKLPALWKGFLQDVCCSSADKEPLFVELVNESLLEKLCKNMFGTPRRESSRSETVSTYLSEDEQNIIRYACGYVGMKLYNRFVKQPGEKAATFVECIDHMRADGPTSSLLEYTREWVDKVNRGGLFDVSDEAYYLFIAIETAMQERLTSHLQSSFSLTPAESQSAKKAIVDHVLIDCDVQFHWCMLSVDIPDDRDGLELLRHVVELWLTIRGFGMSKAWMEEYKRSSHTSTKGKKSLRKDLKRAGEPLPHSE